MNPLCHRSTWIVIAVAALAGCRKKPAPSAHLDIVHTDDYDEGPCRTDESEPGPANLYVEPSGASPFGVAARGPLLHPRLVRPAISSFRVWRGRISGVRGAARKLD